MAASQRAELDDELKGTAYAIIEGVDGRSHHLRFASLEMTGDGEVGAIVEARAYADASDRRRLALAVRSDLALQAQVPAQGATWLDRQLLAREPAIAEMGFGSEVRDALARRAKHLEGQGLARRQGQRWVFPKDLLATLREREFASVARRVAEDTGLAHRPAAEGEHVAGVYRGQVTLASGRLAMIDDELGFQLVPWRPALEPHLGRQVSGVMAPNGGVDWSFGRRRGVEL